MENIHSKVMTWKKRCVLWRQWIVSGESTYAKCCLWGIPLSLHPPWSSIFPLLSRSVICPSPILWVILGRKKLGWVPNKSVWGSQCWRVRNYATLLSSLPSWVSRTPGKLYIRFLAHQSESTTDFPPQWSHTSISYLAMPVASSSRWRL